MYFMIVNFHREQTSGKGQPWFEFSSIYTVHNIWWIMDS